MRGTICDYHGKSEKSFRYGDRDVCWECEDAMWAAMDAVKRVRELHYATLDDTHDGLRCQVCWSETYPCPTIKALDGVAE